MPCEYCPRWTNVAIIDPDLLEAFCPRCALHGYVQAAVNPNEEPTREEIERQAQADDGSLPEGWEDTVVLGIPGPKRGVYLRLDPDVLDWFKAHGAGYQTRINAVLRGFVHARRRADDAGQKPK